MKPILKIFYLACFLNLFGLINEYDKFFSFIIYILPFVVIFLIMYKNIILEEKKQKLILSQEEKQASTFNVKMVYVFLGIELILFTLGGLNNIFSNRYGNWGMGSEQGWYMLFILFVSALVFAFYLIILIIISTINYIFKIINKNKK